MKIAVISNIHSNIYALESVLSDIEGKKVDIIVCTGDLVGYGSRPNEVINTIREKEILTIMGNYDDIIGNYKILKEVDYKNHTNVENEYLSMIFTSGETTGLNKEFLSNLPEYKVLNFNNKNIRFVHKDINSEEIIEIMEEMKEDILVCGHSHIPYVKYYGEKILIDAGSVGKPETNSPNANYVIINIDEDSSVNVDIVEVEYDFEKAAEEIELNNLLPNDFAKMIRKGSRM